MARAFALGVWQIIGKRYQPAALAGRGAAVAILIEQPWGFQLADLVSRFANRDDVHFITWGPFKVAKALTKQGKWHHSRANSWGSAANFALSKIAAKKVLVFSQEFDVEVHELDAILKLEVGQSPAVLDSNGLILSAGLARKSKSGKFQHSLRGFNVSDLPNGLSGKALTDARFAVANQDSKFSMRAQNASTLGPCFVNFDLRVRYFKNYPEPKRQVFVQSSETIEALEPVAGKPRWAIKNPAGASRRGDSWGDTFFCADLAAALKSQGLHVAEDRLQNWYRPTRKFDDVELVIRGKSAYQPSGKATSILWVISHPDLVTVEEIRSYDLVFAASASWAKKMSELAEKPVEVLLQATNTSRFKPQPALPSMKSHVLFVGRTRGVFREVVDFAIRAKAKLKIYGDGWREYVEPEYVADDHLSNELVPAAYSSCDVLLNDHWNDMREQGFISNRIFDAAACGTRVLSDHIDGLPEMFGGLVQTYSDFESFEKLVTDTEAWPSDADRKKIAAEVIAKHSFEARAKALIAAAKPF